MWARARLFFVAVIFASMGHSARIAAPRAAEVRAPLVAPRLHHAVALLLLGQVSAQHGPYDVDLFEKLDANLDGIVDRVEYMFGSKDAMDEKGVGTKDVRTAVFDFTGALYERSDVNGDGVLCEDEVNFGQYLFGIESKRRATGEAHRGAPPDFDEQGARGLHRALDADQDGRVDVEEFGRIALYGLASMNYESLVAEAQAPEPIAVRDRLFLRADNDDDGSLSFRELQYASFLIGEFVQKELVSALLFKLDSNLNGTLELEELADRGHVHSNCGGLLRSLVKSVLESFEKHDTDGDGTLQGNEVVHVVREFLATKTGELG